MSVNRPNYRFTVAEYERMIEVGILTENSNVELIRGEIVKKMTIGDQHVRCVNRLNRLLSRYLLDVRTVSIQNPIRLSDSEPESDVTVIPLDLAQKPNPDEISLLIEVADSTFEYDHEVKLPLYAEAGIADVWLVDLNENRVLVHRDPRTDGTFGDVRKLCKGDSVSPLAFPELSLSVDAILP